MDIIHGEGTLTYMAGIDSNPSANPADIPGATQYVPVPLAEMAAGQPVRQPVTRS